MTFWDSSRKHPNNYLIFPDKSPGQSHPSRVRGLKHVVGGELQSCAESHPSRVRGLKPETWKTLGINRKSHPSRVRGLKLLWSTSSRTGAQVAPLAGAWIETRCTCGRRWRKTSHPSRVRGLKRQQTKKGGPCSTCKDHPLFSFGSPRRT